MSRRRHRRIDQPIVELGRHPTTYVTVAVLADFLEVDRRTVVRMIVEQALGAVKVGREWRVPTREAQRAFGDAAYRHSRTIQRTDIHH